MTYPQAPAEGPPTGRPAAADAFAASADERDRLERELRADPCNLVRRACQLADYDFVAPSGSAERPKA